MVGTPLDYQRSVLRDVIDESWFRGRLTDEERDELQARIDEADSLDAVDDLWAELATDHASLVDPSRR